MMYDLDELLKDKVSYRLLFADFSFEQVKKRIEKLVVSFPEVVVPAYHFDLSGEESISNYVLYQKGIESESQVRSAIRATFRAELEDLGDIRGSEIKGVLRAFMDSQHEEYVVGEYVRVLEGDFKGCIVPVIEVKSDSVVVRFSVSTWHLDHEFSRSSVEKVGEIIEDEPATSNILGEYMENGDNKAIVIDGMNVIYRSAFRNQNMFVRKGSLFIGAGYGFYITLLKLRQIYPEYHIYVVFDGYDQERFLRTPEFKANKKKFTQVFRRRLVENVEWVKKVLDACGVAWVLLNDRDGGDVIASLVSYLEREKGFNHIYVYSMDNNIFKMVSDTVHMIQPKATTSGPGYEAIVTPKELISLYGVTGEKLNWMRASLGDFSDKIISVNRFNLENHMLGKRVSSKDVSRLASESGSLVEYKEKLKKELPQSGRFLNTGKFDSNLEGLKVNEDIFRSPKSDDEKRIRDVLPFGLHSDFDRGALEEAFRSFSMHRELERIVKVEAIFKTEW